MRRLVVSRPPRSWAACEGLRAARAATSGDNKRADALSSAAEGVVKVVGWLHMHRDANSNRMHHRLCLVPPSKCIFRYVCVYSCNNPNIMTGLYNVSSVRWPSKERSYSFYSYTCTPNNYECRALVTYSGIFIS